jgi:hypothetical protein
MKQAPRVKNSGVHPGRSSDARCLIYKIEAPGSHYGTVSRTTWLLESEPAVPVIVIL